MADVLHVYKEVEIINDGMVRGTLTDPPAVTISYDEKPGLQAISNTAADLPPVVGQYPEMSRDYEYKRLGTVSLLAGLDLHTGKVMELISDTHQSKDFVEFLQKLDEAYDPKLVIRLVLDNHSAHLSKETKRSLATKPQRFSFVFTPKHGSWLNMVELLFSKMARTVLRHIRVTSTEELIESIHLYLEELNQEPVVFRWKYRMDEIANV